MSSSFARVLKRVAIAHIAVVAVLTIVSLIQGWVKPKPEIQIPVDFMMIEPASAVVDPAPLAPPEPESTPEPAPEPEPPPVIQPPPAPDPIVPPKLPELKKPEPRKKAEITRSTKPWEPSTVQPTPRPQLSEEEIRRMLDAGAKPTTSSNVFATEDSRCLAIIQRTLYSAWRQPMKQQVGDSVTKVAIELGSGGVVKSTQVVERSGNAALDGSVSQAVNQIRQIGGLTAGFIERHPVVTVAFTVE